MPMKPFGISANNTNFLYFVVSKPIIIYHVANIYKQNAHAKKDSITVKTLRQHTKLRRCYYYYYYYYYYYSIIIIIITMSHVTTLN